MTEPEKTKRPSRPRRRRGRGRPRGKGASDNAPLHQRSTSHFKAPDRARGERYFEQGRVRLEVEDTRARGRVRGRERKTYGVGLDWSRVERERRLHVFCECERFAAGVPCKHLWASLLELSARHPDVQPPGKDRIGLRKDTLAQWGDLGLSSEPHGARRSARDDRGPRGRRRRSPADRWRTHLDWLQEAIQQARDEPNGTGDREHATEVDAKLLVNTAASASAGELVLDLCAPDGTADDATLRPVALDLDQIEELLGSLNAGQPSGGTPSHEDAGGIPMTALTRHGDAAVSPGETASGLTRQPHPGGLMLIAAIPDEASGASRRPGRRRKTSGPGRSKPHTGDFAHFRSLRLPRQLYGQLLPRLCAGGRLRLWDGQHLGALTPLAWDHGPAWSFALRLEIAAAGRMRLRGALERDEETIPLSRVQLIVPHAIRSNGDGSDGSKHKALVFFAESVAPLELRSEGDMPWITLLREEDELVFPEQDLEEAVTTLLEMPGLPKLETPQGFELAIEMGEPQPKLVLEPEDTPEWMKPQLLADVSFRYGELEVNAGDDRAAVVDPEGGRFIKRDMDRERALLVRLPELGFKPTLGGRGDGLELDPKYTPVVAEALLLEGWEVIARGTTMRAPSPPALRVKSGVDWFELSGQVEFAGDQVQMSRVLDAISRGERTLELKDGSHGLLPSAWIDTYGQLAQLAQSSSEEGLRFLPSQALLVDALLVAMPPADVDRTFAELREKLRTFEKIKPKKEPRGFGGVLRSYQRMGLGWLSFLREFGLGGILADDMGLGKTVQALALLKTYRAPAKSSGLPNLVVSPRSLIYNWIDEAERFTPGLRVVEYSGPNREDLRESLKDYDLAVTTYGTLRRDIAYLATQEFDTIILDEAQAIKNPDSQTAKASRLLNAQHRLALTGTPIENHLGELGSIFDFLNPGLLGRLPALDVLAGGREASKEELKLVAKGIRPFILRRTKQEVLADLPEKTEQVLYCTMRPEQRELYDQLRNTYRESLLEQVESKGLGGSTMQVLEALLRLRQVACHPGLVDPSWEPAGSAKLDSLFEQVSEVLAEGHKALVFSQFTSLLAKVRARLDENATTYAYLDGQTRDRAEVVDRFQTDPGCNLFLISLKAGGVGLNLTAASYVFLLDPWWNPAVEAQAIDRAHRIGQQQPVFAYRLIAKDTVEQRMLDLQASKRQLAEAILDGEGEGVKDLTVEDLQLLLS